MFTLPADANWWTRSFLRMSAGIKDHPGMSKLLRFLIKDRGAFRASIDRIADIDFERVVVAHGEPIVDDAKRTFLDVIDRAIGEAK